jgi:hypothetical protein
MQITDEQLQSFIEIYKNEFDILLTTVDAQQKALSLLRFLAVSVIPFDTICEADKIGLSDLGNTNNTQIFLSKEGQR